MEKNIKINGLNFHYTVQGNGSPIVLMHGWGCNSTTLASIENVAAENHTVYNVDFPGFGKSQEPTEVTFTSYSSHETCRSLILCQRYTKGIRLIGNR